MKKWLCLVVLLKMVSAIAQIDKFRLLNYGLFKDEPNMSVKQQNRVLLMGKGKDAIEYLTDSLILEEGMEFGVDFVIESEKNENTFLIVQWEFPDSIYITGEGFTKNSMYNLSVQNNVSKRISLILNKEDLKEGIWKVTIKYAPELEYRKSFYLYRKK